MRLKRIYVEDLFDCYSYPVELVDNRPITLIHAPNGYGKTTLLKLVKSTVELDLLTLCEVPYSKLILDFDDEVQIEIKKTENDKSQKDYDMEMMFEYRLIIGDKISKITFQYEEGLLNYVRKRKMSLVEYLYRNEVARRRRFGGETVVQDKELESTVYDSFMHIKKKLNRLNDGRGIQVSFIDSNRLFLSSQKGNSEEKRYVVNTEENDNDNDSPIVTENIVNFSTQLQEQISVCRREFGEFSEKKERDFPNRLVEFVDSQEEPLSDEEIESKLQNLEIRRTELESVGLVLRGNTTALPKKGDLNPTMLKFYTLYINDTEEKLRVLESMKIKLELFLDIINNKTRFSNKKMRIDTQKGVVFEPTKTRSKKKRIIPLDKLSSGEKHDFILFYQLIFNTKRNSIVLIDEPEISLHVAWQMEFVSEIKKICELNGIQAIVATHSPDIVNGNNDILVSLGDE